MNIFSKLSKNTPTEPKISSQDYIYEKLKTIKTSSNIFFNGSVIDKVFINNSGVIKRTLLLGKQRIQILLFYMEGMVNSDFLSQNIIDPIVKLKDLVIIKENLSPGYIKESVITPSSVDEASTFDVIIYELLSGSTILFVDGLAKCFIIANKGIKGRSVDKPDSEQTIRGAKYAFVENIDTNVILIRTMLKTPDLAVETLNIGKRTKTSIALIYLKGVINKDLPEAVKNQIDKINIDGIVDSSQIHYLIQKHKWTLFPQILTTERIDRTISTLLDGRCVIIVDGSPFVLILPTTFDLFLSTPDDYYGKSIITSLLRIIRYMVFFEACTISALYLALTTYNPGLIPTSLVLSITGSRVGLPFPVVIEILLMEITLYLIQEAAIRLPKVVGQTVGIVGGLVIGQAVVQAGIVSPIIVIIVSMSAISSFTLPNYVFALSTIAIRLFLIFCSSILGLYGFVMGLMFILIHAASLENLGVKYLSKYSPYNKEELKDSVIIAPLHTMHKRPAYLKTEDTVKSRNDTKDDT